MSATGIRDWLQKCRDANTDDKSEIIALVPVASNTRHWKDGGFGVAAGVAFLYDTRLRFLVDGKDGGKGAPMACAMIYWWSHYKRFEEIFLRYGSVVPLSHLFGRKMGIMRSPAKSVIKSVHPSQLERFRRDHAITPLITEHGLHHQAGQGT